MDTPQAFEGKGKAFNQNQPTIVESRVTHELSSEVASNKSGLVGKDMKPTNLSKIGIKVFKIVGWLSLATLIILIGLRGYSELQIEKELSFETTEKWEWHDRSYRIQITKNHLGQSILRRVNLSKKYIVSAMKNKDLSLIAKVFFIVDCQPNSKITTSQTFSDGTPKILKCNEGGNFLAFAALWEGKDTNIIWEENLDGFNFKEDFSYWDFTKLDQEITLSNSK